MIYLVQAVDGGPIKLGTTRKMSQRLKKLVYFASKPLRVLGIMDGGYKEERDLHRKFDHLRIVGEWYHPGPDILEFIAVSCRTWEEPDKHPGKPVLAKINPAFAGNYTISEAARLLDSDWNQIVRLARMHSIPIIKSNSYTMLNEDGFQAVRTALIAWKNRPRLTQAAKSS